MRPYWSRSGKMKHVVFASRMAQQRYRNFVLSCHGLGWYSSARAMERFAEPVTMG